jgi:transposase-like protein
MFTNLKQLIAKFQDEQVCRDFLVKQRWNGKPVCPYCGCDKHYVIENGKRFKCANSECYKKYSVTVGSIFHASNVPLSTWMPAMYLIASHKKGISSCQLARDLGVTQKTAWFMLHRIRESLRDKSSSLLSTMVEVDEVWIGGKMKNKHKSVRAKAHADNTSHTSNKTGVMGLLQREGDLRMNLLDAEKTLKTQVKENVAPEAVVITDSLTAYKGLDQIFEGHGVVNHIEDEYVNGIFHTNGIEGAFGLFKRMILGIYHQTSVKHLSRYCDEFVYRYNSRKISDSERFNLTLARIEGKLPYKILVQHGKKSSKKESN